jgi:hypothetical protein
VGSGKSGRLEGGIEKKQKAIDKTFEVYLNLEGLFKKPARRLIHTKIS